MLTYKNSGGILKKSRVTPSKSLCRVQIKRATVFYKLRDSGIASIKHSLEPETLAETIESDPLHVLQTYFNISL